MTKILNHYNDNSSMYIYFFYVATILLIYLVYLWTPHAIQFLFISSGMLLFSFFAKKAINQIFG